MRTVRDTALAFDAACREAGVRYAFVEGIAVVAWGQPRATFDVDALVELDEAGVARLRPALAARGLASDAESFHAALAERGRVSVFDEQSAFRVDAKIASKPAEIDQVDAAIDLPFDGGRLRVQRPEHTVAFKLAYGSPQDLQDARSILVRQGARLDHAELAARADALGVGVHLLRLLAEIREAPKRGSADEPARSDS